MLQNIMLPDGNIDPDAKLLEITRRVVDAVRVPVTVKTRLGWNHEQALHHLAGGTVAGLRHSGTDHPRAHS